MRRALMFLVACLVSSLTLASSALASSPSLVISEIYAAGGNAGALYANDYVELFNRGGSTVDVSSWSVQYATAAGNTWSATPLAGSIAPGRHLLVQLGPTGTVGSPLPAPDVTGTTNLAASGGKIALVHDSAAILCGAHPAAAPVSRRCRTSSATARPPTTKALPRRLRSMRRRPPCARVAAAPTPTRTPPTSRGLRLPRRARLLPRRPARARRRAARPSSRLRSTPTSRPSSRSPSSIRASASARS